MDVQAKTISRNDFRKIDSTFSSLIGRTVYVELRDGSHLSGTLENLNDSLTIRNDHLVSRIDYAEIHQVSQKSGTTQILGALIGMTAGAYIGAKVAPNKGSQALLDEHGGEDWAWALGCGALGLTLGGLTGTLIGGQFNSFCVHFVD